MKLKTLYKSESSMPNILLLYSTDFADTRSSPGSGSRVVDQPLTLHDRTPQVLSVIGLWLTL